MIEIITAFVILTSFVILNKFFRTDLSEELDLLPTDIDDFNGLDHNEEEFAQVIFFTLSNICLNNENKNMTPRPPPLITLQGSHNFDLINQILTVIVFISLKPETFNGYNKYVFYQPQSNDDADVEEENGDGNDDDDEEEEEEDDETEQLKRIFEEFNPGIVKIIVK